MKKIIAICLICTMLFASCTKKPASSTAGPAPQGSSSAQSKPSASSSKPKREEIKIPDSVSPTKNGIVGEDEKYPVEKLDIKLKDITNDYIAEQNGVMFSYKPLPALPENEGGGIRLYQIKFENDEMYWNYGLVESEYVYQYKGYYTLVQEGMIEATLQNISDEADEMKILLYFAVPTKANADDMILQVKMLSCSNNFFADMADLPLVYHKE